MINLYIIHVAQEPRAFYLKWMSTSGNEFVESKIFVECENQNLKMFRFHNAEISKMASMMVANFEVAISNKTLTL